MLTHPLTIALIMSGSPLVDVGQQIYEIKNNWLPLEWLLIETGFHPIVFSFFVLSTIQSLFIVSLGSNIQYLVHWHISYLEGLLEYSIPRRPTFDVPHAILVNIGIIAFCWRAY